MTLFGERVTAVRKRLGMNQVQFGESLDKTNSYICQIESGKARPTVIFCFSLIETHNVNPVFLFKGTGNMCLPEAGDTGEGRPPGGEDRDLDMIRSVEDLNWLMDRSNYFRNAVLFLSAEYHLKHKESIKASLEEPE